MAINIKKRLKEPTVIEKRNTAVTTFIMAALVPAFLCMLLGFSLGSGKEANFKNLEKKYQELLVQKNTVEAEKTQLEERIGLLENTFFNADSIFQYFNEVTVKELGKNLDDAGDEIALNRWQNDMSDGVDDFKHQIGRVERPLDFSEDPSINMMLEYAKMWLKEYATAKGDELFAEKLSKKNQLGLDVSADLQMQLQELQGQITEKNTQILLLQGQLQMAQSSSSAEISNTEEDLITLQSQLTALKAKSGEIKEGILGELQAIQGDLLPELSDRGLFRGKEIKQFKDQIDAKLDEIKRQAGELN